ncbi:MAG TPA: hypothetical protein PKJ41_09235 [Bryobacteraceae bacterium]|nr:hypothetical protein [Bryobacteraceae bacterium]
MSQLKALFAFSITTLLPAQFLQLGTTRDGSKVAFSSSLSLKSSTRNDNQKIYELSAAGLLRTLRDVSPVILYPGDRAPSNFPILTKPEYDSAGSILAFTGTRWCIGGSGCIGVELTQGTVVWLDGSREAPHSGTVRISANGKWAVYANPTSLVSPYRFYRVNLETGWNEFSATGLSGAATAGRRVVANDGTVVSVPGARTLTVRKPGQRDATIPLSFSTSFVTISNDASFAIAQTTEEHPYFWLVDLYTQQQIPFLWAAEGVSQPALSDDGMTLLFLSAANFAGTNDSLAVQVWTMDMITGHLRQWTTEPFGISEATISGDGLIVWATTRDGRLVRVDGLSGITEPFLQSSPQVNAAEYTTWAPGSRYRFEGAGLNSVSLSWQGLAVPIVNQAAESLEFIVPWEAATGSGAFEIDVADSPFQPLRITGEMRAVAPQFIKTAGFIHALRQDLSPLTVATPARPGETVTLLMRGLGPVDSQGRTLQPSTVFSSAFPSIEIVSSEVDLGTPGTYRLAIRVPAITEGPLTLFVRGPGDENAADSGLLPVEP